MKKTIIVVESPNDVAFYKKLCSLTRGSKTEDVNAIDIVEFEDLHNFDYDGKPFRGYSLRCLIAKLQHIKRQLDKDKYQHVNHIAVIVDTDSLPPTNQKPNREQDGGIENRLYQISKALNEVFNTKLYFEHSREGNIIKTTINLGEETVDYDFSFSCFLTKNAAGLGNLDYLLKDLASKSAEAHHANCLYIWQECLENKQKPIKESFLTKLWVDYYIRLDTASSPEKRDAEIKLNFPDVMENKGEDIFDFSSILLNPFKEYLSKL